MGLYRNSTGYGTPWQNHKFHNVNEMKCRGLCANTTRCHAVAIVNVLNKKIHHHTHARNNHHTTCLMWDIKVERTFLYTDFGATFYSKEPPCTNNHGDDDDDDGHKNHGNQTKAAVAIAVLIVCLAAGAVFVWTKRRAKARSKLLESSRGVGMPPQGFASVYDDDDHDADDDDGDGDGDDADLYDTSDLNRRLLTTLVKEVTV